MKKIIRIPRIIKINWVKGLSISVVFNNGESRMIDFKKVLKKIGVNDDSPARILYNPDNFAEVVLEENTLSWHNVIQYITLRNGEKMRVPFEIGADVLYNLSLPEPSENSLRLGQINTGCKTWKWTNPRGSGSKNRYYKNLYIKN